MLQGFNGSYYNVNANTNDCSILFIYFFFFGFSRHADHIFQHAKMHFT